MSDAQNRFAFFSVPRLLFASGGSREIAAFTRNGLGERVMLVTDPIVLKLGLCAGVMESLTSAGADVFVFDAIDPDPKAKTVIEAARIARERGATGVVGVGGGSSLDVAKVAALLAGSNQDIDEAWGVNNATGPRLPLALLPTTAGTGSEATPVAIFTLSDGEKRGVSTPLNIPDWAILDPDLTLGLPKHVTAMTGLDAMIHAIEAFTSINPNNNPLSQLQARQAMALLCGSIEKAYADGSDAHARGQMLLGSYLAGQAFANSPVGAVHALAYPVGGGFAVPHGLSTALMLPHVMRFNQALVPDLYADLAVWAFPELAGVDGEDRGDIFIEKLDRLRQALGLAGRLREVGIEERHLARMASDAMKQQRLLVNNPRPVSEAEALYLYKAAW